MTASEKDPNVLPALPSKDHLMMQLVLFSKSPPPPRLSERELRAVLTELRAQEALEPFRIWLVGSLCDRSPSAADIDIVLSPSRAAAPSADAEIDRALWSVRLFGLRHEAGPLPLDPTYRSEGPARTIAPLRADDVMIGIQLVSPRRMHEAMAGRLPGYRLVGRFSVEFSREAGETSYYAKLPRRTFDGQSQPYLRAASEVLAGPEAGR